VKVGDLVRMKCGTQLSRNRHTGYTDDVGIVYGTAGKGIKVLMPDNTIKIGLQNQWEVVQEAKGAL
jgi:hypothetical protein